MKGNPINWKDFIIGVFLGAAFVSLVMVFYIPNLMIKTGGSTAVNSPGQPSGSSNATDEPSSTIEHKSYVTDTKDWTITTESGETMKFYTPDGWYSLTDQYVDNLASYYNVEVDETNLVCVGNNAAQYQSTATVNMATLSKLHEIMEIMYADDENVNVDDLQYSEAYIYMTTGSLPEGVGDSYTIEEKDTIEKDGITYRSFLVGYDTEYYTDDTKTETTTVHTDELMCYSDTKDAVEIVVYMSEWDTDEALKYLHTFIEGN